MIHNEFYYLGIGSKVINVQTLMSPKIIDVCQKSYQILLITAYCHSKIRRVPSVELIQFRIRQDGTVLTRYLFQNEKTEGFDYFLLKMEAFY